MSFSENNYLRFGATEVFFSKKHKREIEKMRGRITLVSTVCPDYPNDGKKYLFEGSLGEEASLTAMQHIKAVPPLIGHWKSQGIEAEWLMLVADLPELVDSQKGFCLQAAGSKEFYLDLCRRSARFIEEKFGQAYGMQAMTFSEFYGQKGYDYLKLQEAAAEAILASGGSGAFGRRFRSFAQARRPLAEKFRGKKLSPDELAEAAAHGMSLYATHGTLLKEIFRDENLVVINHFTTNLRNFRLNGFVPGRSHLQNEKHFPVGVVNGNLY